MWYLIYALLTSLPFVVIFGAIDVMMYIKAPWPERAENWMYKLPGGGIVAYYKLKKKD